LSFEATLEALARARTVPGRMECFGGGAKRPLVVVDYAHTPDALEKSLTAARSHCRGRLWCVFGCGGDRDPGKRPLMGKIAGELADLVIATSDNPRSEDPLAILAAVEAGLKESGNCGYRLVPDRREAIRQAIAEAEPGWAVLVAGKGHETYQILGDKKLPFSDIEETVKALEARRG
jgi:UDP-N-acetylmuramoyl-L-alanyl-D-glutamate--2,6-diaminopimelate ligase